MIFVTLGTHEAGFDRLVNELDRLKQIEVIEEKIFIQGMLGKYVPKQCMHRKSLPYDQLCEKIIQAKIVITHGGPGSIMLSLRYGKVPIVVPRMHKFGEHVDDHQVRFVKKLEDQNKILAVYNIENLKEKVCQYNFFAPKCVNPSFGMDSRRLLMNKLNEYCLNLAQNQ